MDPIKQQKAMLLATGWKQCDYHTDPVAVGLWYHPDAPQCADGKYCTEDNTPDHLNDLNAMHEAEKVLPVAKRVSYMMELTEQIAFNRDLETSEQIEWATYHATAAQRAEAFLRTIGKWEESS